MKRKIYRHLRIKDGVRQYHDAYVPLSEYMLKLIPDKYWNDDLPSDQGSRITKIFIDECNINL